MRAALRNVCAEVTSVASSLEPCVALRADADAVLAIYDGMYGVRPSMLQDLDAGRPLERAAIVQAIVELGRGAGVATPKLELLSALLSALDPAAERTAE